MDLFSNWYVLRRRHFETERAPSAHQLHPFVNLAARGTPAELKDAGITDEEWTEFVGNANWSLMNLGSPLWFGVVWVPLPFGIAGLVMLVAAGRALRKSGLHRAKREKVVVKDLPAGNVLLNCTSIQYCMHRHVTLSIACEVAGLKDLESLRFRLQ